jgi:hypothetical protein
MYDVTPFSTNVGELAPSELVIPTFIVQPTVVEYCKEGVTVERIGGCV